jgi:pimeloyl-ACP methyl ester carboxylesterase
MHDPFVPPEYALLLARRVKSGQVHVLDRASHHPQEERPRPYHRIVSAFLETAGTS